jgi:hypothetical protein
MAQRRSLAVGLVKIESADPRAVEAFIRQESAQAEKPARPIPTAVPEPQTEDRSPGDESTSQETETRRPIRPLRRGKPSPLVPIGLIPVTVRLRPEVASALKRASLERELAGIETHTQQQIVEEALLPWLRSEGVLE